MLTACHGGHLQCVQVLSSYGASRSFQGGESAEDVAAEGSHDELVAWLFASRDWATPLHHLRVITATRARDLLRTGANCYAVAREGAVALVS